MFNYRNGRRSLKKSREWIGSLGRQLRLAGMAKVLPKIGWQIPLLFDNAAYN
jgi:hypothetical protein